eukprot:TRINITY_DN19711_c0_g1_i1.p2 TRINITY_DN19711_c0_g1~~TRINITY_DN19711_c0_g1_i1.p2  ORF type:complete len:151 (-),score=58.32 TRINITY_DN19711_c0_g1_i1:7-396(-)
MCIRDRYTPANEHFGIVPLEGMYNRAVVIACNSGGPLETVEDGKTGYLLEPQAESWGKKITEVLSQPKLVEELGNNGRTRVTEMFTNDVCADQLDDIVRSLLNLQHRNCLLYTSPSPRDLSTTRMPSSA